MAEENESVEPSDKSKANGAVGELKGIGFLGKAIGVIVIVWLASVSYYAVAFFALGMLPAIVASILDRGAGRFASRTVSACNFIGILPFLFDIALAYERSLTTKQLMAEPITWLVVYGASAIGWMLIWVLPQLTMMIYTIRADLKRKSLLKDQDALVDEWGDEVKTGKDR